MILAGDIGGTHTRLALFEGSAQRPVSVISQVYPSRIHRGLEEILQAFLTEHRQPVEAAAFGIAGPVKDGRVQTPNLPWNVDSRSVAQCLGLGSASLLNDLEANAHGIAVLEPGHFVTLYEGDPEASGNRALISAGTGLGEAGLIAEGNEYRPYASEGGHADFAPRTEIEVALLRHLWQFHDHVSYERVLSGPGLHNIYQFLRDTRRAEEPASLAEEIARRDPPRVIAEHALAGDSPICALAMDMLVSIYGAEAGNLALRAVATGGLYLGGGIAPQILPKLRDPALLKAFRAKGRLSNFLDAVPVRVIMNDQTALLGAARVALLACTQSRIAGVE
jgi:glucokinase